MQSPKILWIVPMLAWSMPCAVNDRKIDTGEVRITRICMMPVEADRTRVSRSGREAALFVQSLGHLLDFGAKTSGGSSAWDTDPWPTLYMTFVDPRSGEVLTYTGVDLNGERFWKEPSEAFHGTS